MKLNLHAAGVPLDEELRQHIDRRLHFSLNRFADGVESVRLSVTDVNGPRGGEGILVKLHILLRRQEELLVAELHHDPLAAVARACRRASQAVGRRLERLKTRRARRRLLPLPE